MKFIKVFFLFVSSILFSSCVFYSFTGASIPEGAKTVSVKYFQNNASIVQPTLSGILTEGLQNKFTSQSNLTLVEKNGDLHFEGQITAYSVSPIAIQSNETAALNRLTINVSVKFSNKMDAKQDFETTFSRFADYNRSKNLVEVEDELIKEITLAIIDDIFNKAVVNW